MRSAGKAVSGTLFAIFLGLALTLMAVVNLTNYQTLQPLATSAISQQINSSITPDQLSQQLNTAKQQCQGHTQIQVQLQGMNFTIPCSTVNNATPQDVPNLLAQAVVNQTMQKTYSCQPIQCLETLQGSDKLFYIFSSDFHSFLQTIVYALWILTAITAVGYFFALEGVAGRLKGFGAALVWIGVPYIITRFMTNILLSMLPSQAVASIQPLITQMIDQLSNNFLYAFVIGVVLLVAGFILGLKRKKK